MRSMEEVCGRNGHKQCRQIFVSQVICPKGGLNDHVNRMAISLPLGSTSSKLKQWAHQQCDDGSGNEDSAWV